VKFADFHPGQRLVYGPVTITESQIISFAREYDPQWFHTDIQRAETGPWQGLIASGWQTCGIAMRLVVEGALQDSESFGSPGLEYLKWLAPVRPGDALSVRAEVLDVRRSTRKTSLGVLRWRWQLANQRDEDVLDLLATSLFELGASNT
jgi:acyl dehydratase